MRLPPILFVLASAASLTAAAAPTARAGGLPACNAKHKRPANPYGSVLSEGFKPALAAATRTSGPTETAVASDEPKASAPGSAKPQKVSRAEWRASFAPCARDRV